MDSEVTGASADSDGSVSWEDFFGTSTDLVPQLLGVFDELARKDHVNNHGDQIPAAIQKRLSLVAAHSQRNTIFGQICGAGYTENHSTMKETETPKVTVNHEDERKESTKGCVNATGDKYNNDRLTPEHALSVRQKKHLGRPLSGSSIASSTSSSGGSNQENNVSANPYLASVESLADACASSQVSGDSGVGGGSSEETLDPLNRRKPNVQDSSTVERVLLEIVDTEAIYVEHLCQVIQGYLIVWRDDPNSLLTDFELTHLFNNIEDIFNFNNQFLKEIKDCQLEPILVANTFIKHNLGFKVYTEYCTKYPRAVSILTELMGREETAKAFRERQEALGHALPLGSFLLKPVQRILKYHLLLENLSKELEADETWRNSNRGKSTIEEALKAMTGIAEHINAMKRKHEHAVRVQEIQSLLYGWSGPDLTTNGELIAEGRFRMRGAKAPRHAFLFERMLLLTKKKEDGLLVYKAHIMCSNLMLIESIPGEPSSFHVIPFDNPRLQYTLQARNLEHKREWTLQIKRVMLENYNAVIPIHARQLVLQLGQSQQDEESSTEKISMKKLYSSPPEYLERRKQEKDRRRSEAGLRPKAKKIPAKFDGNENSSFSLSSVSSSSSTTSSSSSQRDQSLNRSLDGRASRVKEKLTNWRRKSEPGFQSYVSFNHSDDDQDKVTINEESNNNQNNLPTSPETPENPGSSPIPEDRREENLKNNFTNKDVNIEPQTVEQIVGHILMQNEEFQKLLEKQRNNSMTNVRQQQRFHKEQTSSIPMDTSEESDNCCENYTTPSINNRITRLSRITGVTRERREYRSVRSNNNSWNATSQRYQSDKITGSHLRLQYNNFKPDNDQRTHDKTFKRQSILTESKIIKTALRMNDESKEEIKVESPTRPSVWLTKLCEDLPTSPQKSGSLPRSFQINSDNYPQEKITKSRFLQRDGKPLNERPFTIASDKPEEITLEDMERYSYQSEEQINKLSNSELNSASTFFCSLEDNSTVDSDSDRIHPDHKIYRNTVGSTMLKNVLSKAGSRLQGLRLTLSTETLESSDSLGDGKPRTHKGKKRSKSKLLRMSRESSTDVDEPSSGCVPGITSGEVKSHSLYYEQGSEGLGARIAQADYADPSVLFGSYFEGKMLGKPVKSDVLDDKSSGDEDEVEADTKESDCFYEKSFETIEDYHTLVHNEGRDDAFRDSAIFSDNESTSGKGEPLGETRKIPPPVPVKSWQVSSGIGAKPTIAAKPDNLKFRNRQFKAVRVALVSASDLRGEGDISAGQSQAGWVRKMVGQLQAQIET
ncbi:uncharacterized protein GEFmeso [Fopius arisanus]|uniref:PLEKHG1_3 protein n=2 Tax=Fopius arisanus TaxID=64838 RepID=A0A0C9PR15_9HYME|nr:PREDICTED: uncharacterized protein LOC105264668 [Fopius arisanus]